MFCLVSSRVFVSVASQPIIMKMCTEFGVLLLLFDLVVG